MEDMGYFHRLKCRRWRSIGRISLLAKSAYFDKFSNIQRAPRPPKAIRHFSDCRCYAKVPTANLAPMQRLYDSFLLLVIDQNASSLVLLANMQQYSFFNGERVRLFTKTSFLVLTVIFWIG